MRFDRERNERSGYFFESVLNVNKKLFIHDVGSGVPVVLIHGYPLNHSIWEHQFNLSVSYRILAPDLPGFGASENKADLAMEEYSDRISAMLDEKKIKKAVVVGHSMGGYIALSFAKRYENRLLGLGLICSQAGADSEEVKNGRLKNAERVAKEGYDFVIETMAEKLVSNKKENKTLTEKLRSIMKEGTSEGVCTALSAMAGRKDEFETLRNLSVPVFIAAGKDDLLISSEKSFQMADTSKRKTLKIFENCGHMPMMENPKEFNLVLAEFLQNITS